jgi:HAE1 family hydrophobic/amphiphilic exporter-1
VANIRLPRAVCAAVGGMLVGTVIGVLIIPGLYYVFGLIADKKQLIRDEVDEPLTEIFEHVKEAKATAHD